MGRCEGGARVGLSSTSISAPHARQVPPPPRPLARSAFEEAGTKSPSCCTRRSRQSPASPGKGPVCPTLCPASHSLLCAYWHAKGSETRRSGVHTLLTLPQGYLHTNTHTHHSHQHHHRQLSFKYSTLLTLWLPGLPEHCVEVARVCCQPHPHLHAVPWP